MLVKSLVGLIACPACRTAMNFAANGSLDPCATTGCAAKGEPIPTVEGTPVLVHFPESILDRGSTLVSRGESLIGRERWRALLTRVVNGTNHVAPFFARAILDEMTAIPDRRGRILIVGGGAVGAGSEALYTNPRVDVISFDIYRSEHVSFIADAHAIPLRDSSIDAVWVQAVLEHVTDPTQVVAEIVRVLTPDGIVFADTPFMWPVHEKAYDFTRWSPSGYRWLFRDFNVIAAGTSAGPGTAAILALRYLVASLTRSTKLGQLLTLPLIPLRFLDRFCDERRGLDAAAGIFFYGRKNDHRLDTADLVCFYDEQLALERRAKSLRRGGYKVL